MITMNAIKQKFQVNNNIVLLENDLFRHKG